MIVIVCGSRGAVQKHIQYNLFNELFKLSPSLIIHGGCPNSADMLAEDWANENGVDVSIYYADWETHGKHAGPERNKRMAEEGADHCVAVWDGYSRGTHDMIRQAVRHEIPVTILPAAKIQ